MTDHMLRLIFSLDLALAVLLFGQYIGAVWAGYTGGQRSTLVGFFSLITYVLAGQVKAVHIGIPFDLYSWGGVAATIVINLGLGWSLWERRPRQGR